jgi:hypothetical protein
VTAAKIIEEIKHLPPQEQAKVVEYVQQLSQDSTPQVRYMDKKDFDVAAHAVFEKYDDLLRRLSQ